MQAGREPKEELKPKARECDLLVSLGRRALVLLVALLGHLALELGQNGNQAAHKSSTAQTRKPSVDRFRRGKQITAHRLLLRKCSSLSHSLSSWPDKHKNQITGQGKSKNAKKEKQEGRYQRCCRCGPSPGHPRCAEPALRSTRRSEHERTQKAETGRELRAWMSRLRLCLTRSSVTRRTCTGFINQFNHRSQQANTVSPQCAKPNSTGNEHTTQMKYAEQDGGRTDLAQRPAREVRGEVLQRNHRVLLVACVEAKFAIWRN